MVPNVPLQPRRLSIAPAADGCKRLLGRFSDKFREFSGPSKDRCDFRNTATEPIHDL
jgi:hypothetical protein